MDEKIFQIFVIVMLANIYFRFLISGKYRLVMLLDFLVVAMLLVSAYKIM